MSGVVKWLAELSDGEAVFASAGSLLAAVVTIVWPVVRAVRKQRKLDMTAADKPSLPVLPMPPVAEELTGRVALLEAEVKMAQAGWNLSEARARVRELEKALADVGADAARTAQALITERLMRERDVARLNQDLAEAIRERDTALRMGQQAIDELQRSKHESASSHSSEAAITPIRPPAPFKGER